MLYLTSKQIDLLYAQMFEALKSVTIVVKFKKKDGTIRVMMGTRNKLTVEQLCGKDLSGKLAGFDKRANIGNHNIPVVDLALGDVRTFCVERLEAYQVVGVLNNSNSEAAFEYYNKVYAMAVKEAKNKETEMAKSGSLIDVV